MMLIYIWEGIFKIGNNEINLMQDYHNPKFIFKNLPIFFSFFLFYILPFEFSQKFKINKKYIIYFTIIFLFLLILNYLNYLEYLKLTELGGGVFLKINNILFKDNLIFFSCCGLFRNFANFQIFKFKQKRI